MKTAQWAGAVGVLAAMVFAVTFLMNYLGSDPGTGATEPRATESPFEFATLDFPGSRDAETRQTGSQDFWFRNKSGGEVEVGLLAKACTCSRVEVFVVPAPSRAEAAAVAAARLSALLTGRGQAALGADLPLDLLTLAACQDDIFLQAAEGKVEGPQPLVKEDGGQKGRTATVRPGAYGWVRLLWSSPEPKIQPLSADLWLGSASGPVVKLNTRARIVPPVFVQSEVNFGSVAIQDLPRGGFRRDLLCWSTTRPSFRLKAKAEGDRGDPASDPLEVGPPARMSADELDRVAKTAAGGPVACGYVIPVTLRRVSADNKRAVDLGYIQRTVVVTSEDEGVEPAQVQVTGVVRGDVTVGGRGGIGAIQLGLFSARSGTRGSTSLESDAPVDLELDRERVPPYLQAEFPEAPEVAASGHRTWLLRVRVLPGKARGTFPRADETAYRDSAIYVKTRETPPRSIRIPVAGTAASDR